MSNRNRAARRAEKVAKAPAPIADDLDTVYHPALTGRDIDLLGNLIDAWVKSAGIPVVQTAMPLLEKVTAPRRAAMKATEAPRSE